MQGLDPELAKDLTDLAGGFTLYYESEGVEMSDAGNKAGDPYGHLAASVLIEGIAEWRNIRITRAITKRKTIPDRAFCLVEWFHSVDAESLMDHGWHRSSLFPGEPEYSNRRRSFKAGGTPGS